MEEFDGNKFSLVLSGGGARGAYEAGVIYYIRTQLPREIRESTLFNIYSGTSVGAINSAFLASSAEDPIYQGGRLRQLWLGLNDHEIYRADIHALTGFLVRSGFFMATNFFGLGRLLGGEKAQGNSPFPFVSVLDTSPFVNFLRRNVPWKQIHRNIERGLLDAVTVSATHMISGQLALFVEKAPGVVYRQGGIRPMLCSLSPKHVLASAAIPIVFPTIRINREFYGDGGLRQNTPMSPSIHMGATRILVISTQSKRTPKLADHSPSVMEAVPTIGDILGTLLDSVFTDKLDYDLEQMKRINFLINDFEKIYGRQSLDEINTLRNQQPVAGKEIHEIQKITPFVIKPSMDIGAIASEHFMQLLKRKEVLTPMQKFFAKTMEGTPDTNNDLVSYLLFNREYLDTMLQMGYEDARKEHDRLVNFFLGLPLEK